MSPKNTHPKEDADSLLNLLSHHSKVDGPLECLLRVPDASKVAWRNIPDDGAAAVTEDDTLMSDPILLGGDSDVESGGDSDTDTLQSAGVWSDVETVKMHLAHLTKLKGAYLSEFERLRYLLREGRRRYLCQVGKEKQTLGSIHSQRKGSVEDRAAYCRLKAMLRYQKHNGRQALVRHALLEKRAAASAADSASGRDRSKAKYCVYSQGSWKCGDHAVPLAKYCVKHILEDTQQVLYRACGSSGGGERCDTPIIPLPHLQTCVYHTPFPLLPQDPLSAEGGTEASGQGAAIAAVGPGDLGTPHTVD